MCQLGLVAVGARAAESGLGIRREERILALVVAGVDGADELLERESRRGPVDEEVPAARECERREHDDVNNRFGYHLADAFAFFIGLRDTIRAIVSFPFRRYAARWS